MGQVSKKYKNTLNAQVGLLLESAQRLRPGANLTLLVHGYSWQSRLVKNAVDLLNEALSALGGARLLLGTPGYEPGYYWAAPSASILVAPLGTNPIENIYGRGVLRRLHGRLFTPPPSDVPDKVVYLRRPNGGMWSRAVANEKSLLARVKRW